MSFVFTFTPTGGAMNSKQYNECLSKLAEAGAANPKGRIYHVCYGDVDNLSVTDVWDSVENFQKFGAVLMPILDEMGIDVGQPGVHAVYNIIEAPAYAG